MKKMIFLTLIAAMISTVTLGQKVVAKGSTFTSFGKYKVEKADNTVMLKGQECTSYNISYENSSMKVTILVCKDKKCRKYLVLSDKLSVQYVCNASYFGVEKIDKSFQAEGYQTSDANLNRLEYFHQKVLGPGQKSESEATGLIAVYFPSLINTTESLTASM